MVREEGWCGGMGLEKVGGRGSLMGAVDTKQIFL